MTPWSWWLTSQVWDGKWAGRSLCSLGDVGTVGAERAGLWAFLGWWIHQTWPWNQGLEAKELGDNEVTNWISWGVTFSAHISWDEMASPRLVSSTNAVILHFSWLWRVEIMGLWYHGRRFRGDEWWMPWNILSVPSYSRWTKLELQENTKNLDEGFSTTGFSSTNKGLFRIATHSRAFLLVTTWKSW